MELIDEGDNFRISIWRGAAYCQVWRRPDVSNVEGARFAAVLMNSLRALLTDPDHDVPGIVFDLREAPAMSGPRTLALLADAVGAWSLAGKHVAIFVGPDEQRAQMNDVVRAHANGIGAVVVDVESAIAYATRLA